MIFKIFGILLLVIFCFLLILLSTVFPIEILQNTEIDIASYIMAITSIVMVMITAISVYFAKIMYNEVKKQRLKDETPNISLRLIRNSSKNYDIEIKNISKVEIYDLQFVEYPSLQIAKNYYTNEIGFIKNGIKYLGVNQVYYNVFFNTLYYIEDNSIIKFKISFFDKDKNSLDRKLYTKNIEINLSLFHKTGSKTFEERLIEQLEEINKKIK